MTQWPLLGCYGAFALGKLGYWGMACKLRPSTQASMSLWLGRQKWQWAAAAVPEHVKGSAGPLRAQSSGECSNPVRSTAFRAEHETEKLSWLIKIEIQHSARWRMVKRMERKNKQERKYYGENTCINAEREAT